MSMYLPVVTFVVLALFFTKFSAGTFLTLDDFKRINFCYDTFKPITNAKTACESIYVGGVQLRGGCVNATIKLQGIGRTIAELMAACYKNDVLYKYISRDLRTLDQTVVSPKMNVSSMPCMGAISETSDASNRYVRYVELPTLQEMASYRVALSIWYNFIYSHSKPTTADPEEPDPNEEFLVSVLGLDDQYWDECTKMIEPLQVPAPIEDILWSALGTVSDETRSWIGHFRYDTFSKRFPQHRIEHFDVNCCVWLPNGKIDYAKTGPKMLSTRGLSFVQKFAILSEFCMEEEIKRFSWRLLPSSFIGKLHNREDYLMYYWIHYLKNELHKIPLYDFNSVDVLMAVACERPHWIAFEYFWNRLGSDDQVNVALVRINNGNIPGVNVFQDWIFSRMSWPQQQDLLSKAPDKILLNFWQYLRSFEAALWAWNHSKNLMTPKQFSNVVNVLMTRWSNASREKEISFLWKMWQSASDRQKAHVIRTKKNEIISECINTIGDCNGALKLLNDLFAMLKEDSRRKKILRGVNRFGAKIDDLDSLSEFIQLSSPNLAEQLEYKRTIMESEEMRLQAQKLFNDGNFEKLILKLRFFSTPAKSAVEFVNWLVESEGIEKGRYVTKIEEWNKVSQFLDGIIPQDVTQIWNLKKKFITSYARDCRNFWKDDTLDEMIKVLEMVFANDDDEFQVVKRHFLSSFEKVLFQYNYWLTFDENNFNKFVLWCLNGDEEALAEFAEKVPVGEIFDRCLNHFEYFPNFLHCFDERMLFALDCCLRWYFKGVEGANQFKLERTRGIEEIELFQKLSKREEPSSLDFFLNWFFNGDEESVRRFKVERMKLGEK